MHSPGAGGRLISFVWTIMLLRRSSESIQRVCSGKSVLYRSSNFASSHPISSDMKEERTVIVRLQGGIGNQFFQYATAYAIAKERDAELILDPTTGFTNDPFRRSFRLSCFTLSGKIADAEDLQSSSVVSSIVSRMYRKTEWILNTRFGLYYLPRLLRPQFGNPLVRSEEHTSELQSLR